MKIPPKMYAKVFSELTKNKSPEEIKEITEKLAKLVSKNGDIGSKEEIIKFAEKYERESNGKHHLLLQTARMIPDKLYVEVLKKFGDGKYDVENSIDEKLLAGIRMVVDDSKELDLSFKKILGDLFDK
ncbi:F0F1 ATP synthase subunit delta [Patescibacteria group bacterium]|nr:F0F1 ATP synthase subunit delta [Patescibacteria group bacterium]